MNLETDWVKKVSRERQIMWHLICKLKKNYTSRFVYKTETDSETQRMSFWLPEVFDWKGEDSQGVWGCGDTAVYI